VVAGLGLATGFASAAGLLDFTIRPYRALGPIQAQATVREAPHDELVVTEHPVEQGAAIADHAFKRPVTVELILAWSNSPSVGGLITGALNGLLGTANLFAVPTGPSQVQQVYAQLLTLQVQRVPFTLYTGKRVYPNMLITSIGEETTSKTENALVVRVTCKQVIIVNTQVLTVGAPAANQALPQDTQAVTNTGSKSLQPNLSAPGGP
jgi:hypothetical protein